MNDYKIAATGVLKGFLDPCRIDSDAAPPHLRKYRTPLASLVEVNASVEVNDHAMIGEHRSEIGVDRLVILQHHSAPALGGARLRWLRGPTGNYTSTGGRHPPEIGRLTRQ